MSVSVRVRDSANGVAAPGVRVTLDSGDTHVSSSATSGFPHAHGRTGEDGRLTLWPGRSLPAGGVYRLEFDLEGYFAMLGIRPNYPTATVELRVPESEDDVNIIVLITPNSCLISDDGN